MRRFGFWSALALILVTNAFVLAAAAYNRSGEPQAVLQLTERELNLSYDDEENTGISLRLVWQQSNRYGSPERPGWFDQSKLVAAGYDCSLPVTHPLAELRYRKALPRRTYAVLEYEGKGWQELLASAEQELKRKAEQVDRKELSLKDLENVREDVERLRKNGSRLVMIDVGKDAQLLFQQYSDRRRFIVAPAECRLVYVGLQKDESGVTHPPYLYGTVSQLLVGEIHVPRSRRGLLEQIRREENQGAARSRSEGFEADRRRRHPPRYTVVIQYGRRGEPWVVDLQPLSLAK